MSASIILVIGEKFSCYKVQFVIGAGGMGEIYRASDVRLLADIALDYVFSALI